MSDCRDDRRHAVKDRLCHLLLVKSPQILEGSASSPDDDHIDPPGIERPDPAHDTVGSRFALHDRGIQDDLDKGIAPLRDLNDVPHRRPRGCGHDTQRPDVPGDRLLVGRIEHSLLQELFFEHLKTLRQFSHSVPKDPAGVELITAAPRIYVDHPSDDHLIAVLHVKRKPPSTACEHDAG